MKKLVDRAQMLMENRDLPDYEVAKPIAVKAWKC